jgi:hypothetical protein
LKKINEKKRKKKKVEKKKKKVEKKTKKKKKEREESLWITVVIYSDLCVGNSKFPTRFSILVNVMGLNVGFYL